jgi:hypothetical protein
MFDDIRTNLPNYNGNEAEETVRDEVETVQNIFLRRRRRRHRRRPKKARVFVSQIFFPCWSNDLE